MSLPVAAKIALPRAGQFGRLDRRRGRHFGRSAGRGGYTVHYWTEGGLGCWAVSDAAPDEFAKFARAFRAAAGK
jgi:anti-sigma factor RsiW